ncbi:glycosyltransferase [Haloferax mediterranei ATCC 33500]|uniref:Dolichol-P-glucose transferase n=1 Tax=Haloferax mediterranei (strain ATCC 33500 / DSM 1411 / JCM 8866 / NBRC 14739 / NCIMB 2177 / R-4) TaxID=523841 RepID=I3R2C7_HALMT|nr:glycosyltransferase [Haloferax mediterranei]AFK18387.2 putative glycosyltransferase, type 2 [Haloferax mediterranei ATCC 33500]AHZ22219.1 dolichol-P-glucose transferase [Haloferax mediterranei ATCC 33500]EMA02338.1 putative glycosyltransferase, type 2 [Haloferax mediterranei ATCC 33500]MDX5988479.1 glycosyltransferase [Haloferax mediterranei ATCC 33500]QCQ74897.1 glycosyltransferase [Haloferax mediterranei ATCC 33500]
MSQSVGMVVPAYRPDPDRLVPYVHALVEELDLAVVRVELDAPQTGVLDSLDALPTVAEVNPVDARRGKGAAITAGFEALDTDIVSFADADGSTPAASISNVVDAVHDGADLAVGSRRHPDATVASHQTVARRYLGDGFAWLARHLTDVPLYDYQCGAKAMTAEAWADVRTHLYEPGFAWDIELIAVSGAFGHRVAEVPVVWEDQPNSTVSPVDTTLKMARGLLRSRHRARTIREDRLHELIDARNDERTLIEQFSVEVTDD